MTETDIAKRIAELPLEKRALLFQQLQKQREKEKEQAEETLRIPRLPRESETYPLSFAQQRLWFLNQFEPESPEYNIPQAFRIEGDLDREVMQHALREVVRRHETLRTTFRSVEGEPAQVIAQVVDMEVPFVDARERVKTAEEAWPEALRMAAADAREPFDLTLGPLMRAKPFRTADRDAFAAGQPSPLPELPIQYLDFGIWQRQWLSGEVLEQQLSYWRRQLGSVPPLELPTDRPRPAVRTHNGVAVPMDFEDRLQQSLKTFAQREGSTLFIVLTAAYKALLHHWTTQEDVSIGTLIANRRLPEIEGLIGFFANSLVLRTDLSGDPTFRELLGRERNVSLDAYAHQDVPFEKLVEELNPTRDMARTPLFQVMLILLNAPGEA